MSKNIPTSCYDQDPNALWNDSEVTCEYIITLNISGIEFKSNVIKDSFWFSHIEIKSQDDYDFIENDIYKLIEDNLSGDIKELDYHIQVLSWKY